MKLYKRAILPLGFKANAVACGIKRPGKLDLALFYSDLPAKASCVFTANKIQAAPILVNKQYLKRGRIFNAIIVNSGNANCFTGDAGIKDAQAVSAAAAEEFGLAREKFLAASTGIIARRLKLKKIQEAIRFLVRGLSRQGINKAKKAILTTDTFCKEVTVKINISGKQITLCGIAKGAGMIAPDMATMLCFILTDANITQKALDKALSTCVQSSFNCITVDGCMSTNDSVMMLANAAAANRLISGGKIFDLFYRALNSVCLKLAKMIVKDGEGASKFIKIKVGGAKNFNEAKRIALAIANSSLFKTAMYGNNPNFGRIAAAAGASGVEVKEKDLKIRVSNLKKKDISVEVSVGSGRSSATVYTSDLTPEYVRINAEYS